MKETIRQRARDLGFDDCRFTTAKPPESAGHFQRWLEQGRHGEMAYLARNAPKRANLELVLPGARTIITLASSYAAKDGLGKPVRREELVVKRERPHPGPLPQERESPAPESADSTNLSGERPTGTIARYARYTDYHDVLADNLKVLRLFVDQLGGPATRSLWYVDTGPLLERDLAQRAGLGFIGKHTSLISRQLGNWFFLSEIITTLEIEPDAPEHNRCGNCTRCISACPTHAIVAPFQLDARLCISYLTIELKGPIPVELRPAIGARIYGCDDCLEACPWNRFAREGRLMRPHARGNFEVSDLIELLSLDEPGFKARFAGTPMLRSKRRGLLRNVCVALGNLGDRASLPALQKAAQDPEPLIAEHAKWAIAQLTSP
jgi:epoxyqueuosine reductase